MLELVLRKILANKRWMSCLLVGIVFAVAMVSSIPMYTQGILQRMLWKDLQNQQLKSGEYPGRVTAQLSLFGNYRGEERAAAYERCRTVFETLDDAFFMPLLRRTDALYLQYLRYVPPQEKGALPISHSFSVAAYSDYEQYIVLRSGKMPTEAVQDGIISVLVSETAQKNYDLMVGQTYDLRDDTGRGLVKGFYVSGVFAAAQEDLWWFREDMLADNVLLMDYDVFCSTYRDTGLLTAAAWSYAYDYNEMKLARRQDMLQQGADLLALQLPRSGIEVQVGFYDLLQHFDAREAQLRTLLWVLQAPVLILLGFYLFMVSHLIVENDRNEIAVLQSRGMHYGQLVSKYLLQSALLSAAGMLLGPLLALVICQVLGASRGFLQLVGRTALPVRLDGRVLLYALGAGVFTVAMMMLPALRAGRVSVVQHKQSRARRWQAPWWQKCFLDVMLLGLALYGCILYRNQSTLLDALRAAGQSGEGSVNIDPLMFCFSTLFALGAGLLFVRLYPYVLQLLQRVLHRYWSTPLYLTFVQVGRGSGMQTFLMLFLVLTVAVGLFNANAARTINQNVEDRAAYAVGADLRVQTLWNSQQKGYGGTTVSTTYDLYGGAQTDGVVTVTLYEEPEYEPLTRFEGVQSATRVLQPEGVYAYGKNNKRRESTLLCVEPYTFGQTAWYRSDLTPYHLNEYLNAMTRNPGLVVVSNALLQSTGLSVGDSIFYTWGGQGQLQGTVLAGVDWWPGVDVSRKNGYFLIAAFDYVTAQVQLEPYQIWYRKAPGTTSAALLEDMQAQGVQFVSFADAAGQITTLKGDPLLQGANGAMTLGFVLTMAVCIIGFVLYWMLTMQNRALQFGIYRAMGMPQRDLLWMLLFEQLLLSLAAVLAGVFVGGIMSRLYVPLMGMVYQVGEAQLPFRVVMLRSDYLKIYAVVGAMLLAGLGMLSVLVRRIQPAQAIKQGEE